MCYVLEAMLDDGVDFSLAKTDALSCANILRNLERTQTYIGVQKGE